MEDAIFTDTEEKKQEPWESAIVLFMILTKR